MMACRHARMETAGMYGGERIEVRVQEGRVLEE